MSKEPVANFSLIPLETIFHYLKMTLIFIQYITLCLLGKVKSTKHSLFLIINIVVKGTFVYVNSMEYKNGNKQFKNKTHNSAVYIEKFLSTTQSHLA